MAANSRNKHIDIILNGAFLFYISTVLYKYGISTEFILLSIEGYFLWRISVTDARVYKIPDKYLILLVLAVLANECLNYQVDFQIVVKNTIIAFILTFILFGLIICVEILKKQSHSQKLLGGGDIKLIFIMFMSRGWEKGLYCLLLSGVIGILLIPLISPKEEKNSMKVKIPFGTSAALAAWIQFIITG